MADGAVPILVVEDSPTTAILAEHWLREGLPQAVDLHRAGSADSAVTFMGQRRFDVVVLDLNLPDSQGIETFRRVQAAAPATSIVILSSEADEEVAVEAVRLGAQDYVVKESGTRNVLSRPVRYALERSRRLNAEEALRENNRQMFVARSIQQHLLAFAVPKIAGLEIAAHCEQADLTGGDFFDFIPTPNGSLGIVVGDVSGHGLPATLMMVETRAVLRALTRTISDARRLLSEANDIISPDLDGRFVTLFFGEIAATADSMRFASAGHPGFLLLADGQVQRLVATTSPLGITLSEQDIDTAVTLKLSPGDLLVLTTDGIAESFSPNGDMFGEPRILDVLRHHRHETAAEIVGAVLGTVHEFRGQEIPADDNTIVVVKVTTDDKQL